MPAVGPRRFVMATEALCVSRSAEPSEQVGHPIPKFWDEHGFSMVFKPLAFFDVVFDMLFDML